MKGRKPNRTQRQMLVKEKLDTYKWLVQKDTPTEMQLVHVDSGEIKVIQK